jgi:putative membrane protein
MIRETKWLVGALAAALWVVPAAAQTSSSDQQQAGQSTSPGDTPRAEPGRGGAGPDAQSAQTGGQKQETAGTGSTRSGSSQQGASDTTAPGAAIGEKAKSMGQHATSDVAHTLAKLHAGNESEVEAGTWMKEHATNDHVKDFAQKMVDDHGSMDKDLMSFAQKQGIDLTSAPKPAEVSKGKKMASLDDLKAMQGAQADRTYMKMMVDDHTKDVKETRAAAQHAKQAKNTEFAKLLDKSAKKMEEHLKDAQKIQRETSQRQARTPSSQ